jgi:hypothetical protein
MHLNGNDLQDINNAIIQEYNNFINIPNCPKKDLFNNAKKAKEAYEKKEMVDQMKKKMNKMEQNMKYRQQEDTLIQFDKKFLFVLLFQRPEKYSLTSCPMAQILIGVKGHSLIEILKIQEWNGLIIRYVSTIWP